MWFGLHGLLSGWHRIEPVKSPNLRRKHIRCVVASGTASAFNLSETSLRCNIPVWTAAKHFQWNFFKIPMPSSWFFASTTKTTSTRVKAVFPLLRPAMHPSLTASRQCVVRRHCVHGPSHSSLTTVGFVRIEDLVLFPSQRRTLLLRITLFPRQKTPCSTPTWSLPSGTTLSQ